MNRRQREGRQVCGATKEDGKFPTWPTRTGLLLTQKPEAQGTARRGRSPPGTTALRHPGGSCRGLSRGRKTQRPKRWRKELAGTHTPEIVRAATGRAYRVPTAHGWLPSPDTEKRSGQGVPQKVGSEREHIQAAVIRDTRPKRLEGARGFTSGRQHWSWEEPGEEGDGRRGCGGRHC